MLFFYSSPIDIDKILVPWNKNFNTCSLDLFHRINSYSSFLSVSRGCGTDLFQISAFNLKIVFVIHIHVFSRLVLYWGKKNPQTTCHQLYIFLSGFISFFFSIKTSTTHIKKDEGKKIRKKKLRREEIFVYWNKIFFFCRV